MNTAEMSAETHPQDMIEQRAAARHLVVTPLTCAEHDPDVFRLIRRHEAALDRWFTQRLGYRLHVDADTARLYKTSSVPWQRPLRTSTGRAFTTREYVCLALVLACTTAGPNVVSLRDLIDDLRSAAAEAGVALDPDTSGRRQVVAVLRWMIDHGLLAELHERVDAYADDLDADAVLAVRADRIALLPLPALTGAANPDALLDATERRAGSRVWLRSRLLEDPVVYRSDLDEADWRELRRRLGDDRALFAELFGLHLEARAEGIAAIDPAGSVTDRPFPGTGTVGHAALLLIEQLVLHDHRSEEGDGATAHGPADHDAAHPVATEGGWVDPEAVRRMLAGLVDRHRTKWSKEMVEHPDRLLRRVLELLSQMRLVQTRDAVDRRVDSGVPGDAPEVRLLPAAHRFRVADAPGNPAINSGDDRATTRPTEVDEGQASLW